MSARATSYVRRHLLIRVNRTKGLILSSIADVADEDGKARYFTQPMIATDLGAALPTVKRSMQSMLRAKIISKAPGRSYIIAGVAGHNVFSCEHVECAAEAEAMRHGAVTEKRRAQAAARARRAREKRKREAAQNG